MSNFSNINFQKDRFYKNIEKLSPKERDFVMKAYVLAEKQHEGTKRHDGSPYFIHCLRITSNLMERFGIYKKEALAAALLHDTVEDTNLKTDDIVKEFGEKTADLVSNLTRLENSDDVVEKYNIKLKKHKETLKKDELTRSIKTLDHLDNVSSWLNIPEGSPQTKNLKRWLKEGKNIHIPMAKTVSEDVAKEIELLLVKLGDYMQLRAPLQ